MGGDASSHVRVQRALHLHQHDLRASVQAAQVRMVHHRTSVGRARHDQRRNTAFKDDAVHAVRSAERGGRSHDRHDLLLDDADHARHHRGRPADSGDNPHLHPQRKVEEHQLQKEHRGHTGFGPRHLRRDLRHDRVRPRRHVLRKPQLRVQGLRPGILLPHHIGLGRHQQAERIFV